METRVNIARTASALLADAWEWYPQHMLDRRVALAVSKGASEVCADATVIEVLAPLSRRNPVF